MSLSKTYLSYILKAFTEAAERFETWRGWGGGDHRTPSQAHARTQISQNVLCVVPWHKQTSLQSLQ